MYKNTIQQHTPTYIVPEASEDVFILVEPLTFGLSAPKTLHEDILEYSIKVHFSTDRERNQRQHIFLEDDGRIDYKLEKVKSITLNWGGIYVANTSTSERTTPSNLEYVAVYTNDPARHLDNVCNMKRNQLYILTRTGKSEADLSGEFKPGET